MHMETKIYEYLPDEGRAIREEVFVEEQGFDEEFDEVDARAMHVMAYENGKPIGVCRFFTKDDGAYWIGRFAVLKEYRGLGVGRLIMDKAEEHIKLLGGTVLKLSAQTQAQGFYEKVGFVAEGEVFFEQHCPHREMKKEV